MFRSYQAYCHILIQSNICDKCFEITRLIFKKYLLNLDDMKNNNSKQRNRIDLQRRSDVIKTHRAKLRVDMNNKDDLIVH